MSRRSVHAIEERIEKKSAQRKRVWASGGDATASAEIDAQLEQLYGELRVARAREANGHRDKIVKRARIERELEKLMSD